MTDNALQPQKPVHITGAYYPAEGKDKKLLLNLLKPDVPTLFALAFVIIAIILVIVGLANL